MPPVVIDVGRSNGRRAVIGAVVAGVVGLPAVGAGLFGAVEGGAGASVAAVVIGAVFLLFPLVVVLGRKQLFRPRALVFEGPGLRWHDPLGAPWAVPWGELAAVVVSKHSPRESGLETVQDRMVGAAADRIVGERATVRLDFFPADPAFARRHPELAHLWERQGVQRGYRLPLGPGVEFIPAITAGMARFAPHLYRGVVATEGVMRLT